MLSHLDEIGASVVENLKKPYLEIVFKFLTWGDGSKT